VVRKRNLALLDQEEDEDNAVHAVPARKRSRQTSVISDFPLDEDEAAIAEEFDDGPIAQQDGEYETDAQVSDTESNPAANEGFFEDQEDQSYGDQCSHTGTSASCLSQLILLTHLLDSQLEAAGLKIKYDVDAVSKQLIKSAEEAQRAEAERYGGPTQDAITLETEPFQRLMKLAKGQFRVYLAVEHAFLANSATIIWNLIVDIAEDYEMLQQTVDLLADAVHKSLKDLFISQVCAIVLLVLLRTDVFSLGLKSCFPLP